MIQELFAPGREGPRAACRLLQSITTREHNLGSPEPRMTSPTVARRRSHSRDHDLSIVTLSCGWLCPFRSTASRDVTGQGPRRGQLASARRLSPRSLAGESFAPTRSARTPLVAARVERRLELPASWERPLGSSFTSVPDGGRRSDPRLPGSPLSRDPLGQGRLTRSPAKGSALRCTRGAFRRWITPAGARRVVPRLSPACGVTKPTPFRS